MGQEGGGEAAAGAVRGVTQGGDSGRIGRRGEGQLISECIESAQRGEWM